MIKKQDGNICSITKEFVREIITETSTIDAAILEKLKDLKEDLIKENKQLQEFEAKVVAAKAIAEAEAAEAKVRAAEAKVRAEAEAKVRAAEAKARAEAEAVRAAEAKVRAEAEAARIAAIDISADAKAQDIAVLGANNLEAIDTWVLAYKTRHNMATESGMIKSGDIVVPDQTDKYEKMDNSGGGKNDCLIISFLQSVSKNFRNISLENQYNTASYFRRTLMVKLLREIEGVEIGKFKALPLDPFEIKSKLYELIKKIRKQLNDLPLTIGIDSELDIEFASYFLCNKYKVNILLQNIDTWFYINSGGSTARVIINSNRGGRHYESTRHVKDDQYLFNSDYLDWDKLVHKMHSTKSSDSSHSDSTKSSAEEIAVDLRVGLSAPTPKEIEAMKVCRARIDPSFMELIFDGKTHAERDSIEAAFKIKRIEAEDGIKRLIARATNELTRLSALSIDDAHVRAEIEINRAKILEAEEIRRLPTA